MFHNIAVIGLGLLGGSLCKGARRHIPGSRITAYGRDLGRLAPALKDGTVEGTDVIENIRLADTDLVVVCTPVIRSVQIISDILQRPDLPERTVIIDVGSVKQGIVDGVADLPRAGQFVGCHPMAGSEKTGYEYSDAGLYRDASVIITPSPKNSEAAIAAVEEFWAALGAKTSRIDPAGHDLRVSITSHVPHITACLLMRLLASGSGEAGIGALLPYIGNGFRDMTRIASGSPDMWSDIVMLNKENIDDVLARFIAEFDSFRRQYLGAEKPSADAIRGFFAGAKSLKDGMPG